MIRIVHRQTVQLVAHRHSWLDLHRESVRRFRPRDRRLRALQELVHQLVPFLLVVRSRAGVVRPTARQRVGSCLVPLDDDALPCRRMPQLLVDRVRRAGRAKRDLLEREPGQQILPRAEFAGQEQVVSDTHRRAPLLRLLVAAALEPPNAALQRRAVGAACFEVVAWFIIEPC